MKKRSRTTRRSVVVEFSITPIGRGESVSKWVARATRVVEASGLPHELHAMGPIVEGEWDEVFDLIKKCHDELAEDCPRLSIAIKVDSRAGLGGRMTRKVAKITKLLKR